MHLTHMYHILCQPFFFAFAFFKIYALNYKKSHLYVNITFAAPLMLWWRFSLATPNDPTIIIVVSFKPCQSALTSILVGMRNATVMTHPSRVYIYVHIYTLYI